MNTENHNYEKFPLKTNTNPAFVLCDECQGHGGWTGLTKKQIWCTKCSMRGFLPSQHKHVWIWESEISRCFNRYACSVPGCNAHQDIDSGD